MKRIIVSVVMALMVGMPVVLANDITTGEERAKENFNSEFPGASFVQWGQEEEFLTVAFVFNNVRGMAFFDRDGLFRGSIRSIFADQLPLAVSRSFARQHADAVILEAYEITNPEGTRYRVVLELSGNKYSSIFYADGSPESIKKMVSGNH